MKSKRKNKKEYLVGLDIGTSSVICLVGEVQDSGELTVLGVGEHPSTGLKRGVVVNIDATVASIQKAVQRAEEATQLSIHTVYAGIAGSHIKSLNSHGIVAISATEVSVADVDRVIDAARAVAIPADQKILHILPQEFTIDQQDGIKDPIGMSGVRLEAKVHMVTGAVGSAQNIEKCIRECDLEPADIILEQLASSYAVLTEDEKELGVCLVDIGAGTTDIAIFAAGAVRHTSVIPVAGDQVTNDLAIAFRMPTRNAEKMKLAHGHCFVPGADEHHLVEIDGFAGRSSRQITELALAQVVQPRYEELLLLIKNELRRVGYEELIPAGVVLTGGASQVKGFVELAEQVFDLPVRVGAPTNVVGHDAVAGNPHFSTAVGLLLYAYKQNLHGNAGSSGSATTSLFKKITQWFQGNM